MLDLEADTIVPGHGPVIGKREVRGFRDYLERIRDHATHAHQLVKSDPEQFGDVGITTLDPDKIADTAWQLYRQRDRPEATFNAFG
ncbi:hypothetical protein [Amycolatopsis anabasis]|uniref:hypothetical protein n=1 Tax=Amycolatopsis anabasis TaxID=1840409 RepID=UPI00131DF612|nr:hypothetical protein [Amycolatopsis anabasis]